MEFCLLTIRRVVRSASAEFIQFPGAIEWVNKRKLRAKGSGLRFVDSPTEQEIRRTYHTILNGKSVNLARLAAERVGQQLLFA